MESGLDPAIAAGSDLFQIKTGGFQPQSLRIFGLRLKKAGN
jgi:hypothetical protein